MHDLIEDFRKRTGVHDFTALAAQAQILGHTEPHVRTALARLFHEGLVVRLSPPETDKKSPWPSNSVIRIFEQGPDDDEDRDGA